MDKAELIKAMGSNPEYYEVVNRVAEGAGLKLLTYHNTKVSEDEFLAVEHLSLQVMGDDARITEFTEFISEDEDHVITFQKVIGKLLVVSHYFHY